MNLNHFSRFEQIAQQLLEGSFGRLFGSQLLPADIAARLAAVMEQETPAEPGGRRPPARFQVHLHPEDLDLLRTASPQLEEYLADYLVALGGQTEIPFSERPEIELTANPEIRQKKVLVRFIPLPAGREELTEQTRTHAPEPRTRTRALSLRKLEETEAFVVVDGKRHVPLGRPLMTVGRHLDNDIVLDVPSVSRHHAQLRWRYGRFVIYDLGSQQGTRVNGQTVTEHVLQAGDVIRLSTVTMIYGEDPLEHGDPTPPPDGTGAAGRRPDETGATQSFKPGGGS
jgi:hypothetical protein